MQRTSTTVLTAPPITPPIVGITTYSHKQNGNYYSPAGYAKAVKRSHGIPILLPPVEYDPNAILELVDGLIFTGGGDIDPVLYDGEQHPTIYGVDPHRDASELPLAQLALNQDLPVLGICRGLEVLIVASGGDLVPHVPEVYGEAIVHRQELVTPAEHSVKIASDSRLAEIIGTTELETVVSWHHQSARTIPTGWRKVAQAADGVIEALEHKDKTWAIALQWHPEMSPDDPFHQQIFSAFVEAARNYKAKV